MGGLGRMRDKLHFTLNKWIFYNCVREELWFTEGAFSRSTIIIRAFEIPAVVLVGRDEASFK